MTYARCERLLYESKPLGGRIRLDQQILGLLAADLDRKTGLCRRQSALADVQERLEHDQRRWTEVREEIVERKRQLVDDADLKAGLAAFEPVCESLSVAEQGVVPLVREITRLFGRFSSVRRRKAWEEMLLAWTVASHRWPPMCCSAGWCEA
ncbi:MAG: hypothetical protein GXY83_38275 [Rhodopirellula sp.]|nr:hypothetical protein [Rhodopirellula sp.]